MGWIETAIAGDHRARHVDEAIDARRQLQRPLRRLQTMRPTHEERVGEQVAQPRQGVDAFGRILGFALRGAGATRLVTTVAFALQWGVQLPLIWFVGVHLGSGLLGIAIIRLLLFAIESIIVTMMWRNGFRSADPRRKTRSRPPAWRRRPDESRRSRHWRG